jgi:hypothetical protein
MEWLIIILFIIFIIMIFILKPMNHTQKVQCYNDSNNFKTNYTKDLVMLPNPNPLALTTHITL